ncbi:hypothetical protein B0H14DRAFT_2633172 [Mycena olivaceomarginata]|nr:hypothetical protein B0H14DRAFT_2633172 [Mycena olivaceomarginata]
MRLRIYHSSCKISAHETFNARIESRKREDQCSNRRKSDAISPRAQEDGGADTFDVSICAPHGYLPTVSAPNTIVSASAVPLSRHKTYGWTHGEVLVALSEVFIQRWRECDIVALMVHACACLLQKVGAHTQGGERVIGREHTESAESPGTGSTASPGYHATASARGMVEAQIPRAAVERLLRAGAAMGVACLG